ncbi:hypothetical protein NCPPB3778_41 [Rathayibacter phage NCPPB3778]|nr:hypothetical protein NCPPB3778_41 [Rathayibacter phage NCPPB3778]
MSKISRDAVAGEVREGSWIEVSPASYLSWDVSIVRPGGRSSITVSDDELTDLRYLLEACVVPDLDQGVDTVVE